MCDESFNTNGDLIVHKLSHLRRPSCYENYAEENLTNGFYHTGNKIYFSNIIIFKSLYTLMLFFKRTFDP